MRQAQYNYAMLAVLLLTSCTTTGAADVSAVAPPLPPGDALPNRVDAMLYGSAQSCRKDAECPGQVCYYGSCIGLLIVDQRWMQESISERLQAEIDGNEPLRERVVSHLERVLKRADTDLAFRARSLVPLEAMKAKQPILDALNYDDVRLQGSAALALTRLGFREGLSRTIALAEHREPAIACEALRALGMSQHDDALVPLLSTLNPTFGDMMLRAALAGLSLHGDTRATRPLIDFLKTGPDHLRHTVTRTLRSVTGESLGSQPKAWQRWLLANDVPATPKYALRAASSEAVLGIPMP